jgi:S-adenosylmethionine:tRNA ribosyltransferase-isomerase
MANLQLVQFPAHPPDEPHRPHKWHGPLDALDFTLPPALEAAEPPEARGLARDDVHLLVSRVRANTVEHARFHDLPRYLKPGDVLVLNTSGTRPAALPATRVSGAPIELHLSTHLPSGLWTIEPRLPGPHGTQRATDIVPGETLALPEGASVTLHAPYGEVAPGAAPRLWQATLTLPAPLDAYLARHGFPIRYGYVRRQWPIEMYQTVYATEPGSAEMPSAGRPFTHALLDTLAARGIAIAPLLLHTGVASLEDHEPPYAEEYRVPADTARLVNAARTAGRNVVAVGTTSVRALESVADPEGTVHPGTGWTDLVVTPQRGLRTVTALLTGLHEPRASHLAMLEALAGRDHLRLAYAAALRRRYLWHEFGDLHLLLP